MQVRPLIFDNGHSIAEACKESQNENYLGTFAFHKIMKHFTQITVAILILVCAGCTTSHFPHGAQVVGGGLKIDWTPPAAESGTAVLVEQASGKMVITKRLTSVDRDFSFNVTDQDDELVLQAVLGGLAPTNAHYVLYFVPGPE